MADGCACRADAVEYSNDFWGWFGGDFGEDKCNGRVLVVHFVGQGSFLQVLRLADDFYSIVIFFRPTWVSVVV